ncbi:MAG: class I SAM-dependent methyltransferase [Accumulibacter sp.]|jgi:SAM-dependent methyltransferase
MKAYIKAALGKAASAVNRNLTDQTVAKYWTEHNVTAHMSYTSPEESFEHFHWRNAQYFRYLDLMPVVGYHNRAVLDYGCGPGHDMVGFGAYSKPIKLVGADLSATSLAEASERLMLHKIDADLIQIDPLATELPFENASFDHIHSSGVLHHTSEPLRVLKEFRRVLKPGGTVNIMIYNYDSVWVHLYVAYMRGILQSMYGDKSLKQQFTHSTDGEHCPISNCYRPDEWVDLCSEAGLEMRFSGAAVSVFEASILEKRFAAIMDRRLNSESRDFLASLSFDERQLPMYRGSHAGIDACFSGGAFQ